MTTIPGSPLYALEDSAGKVIGAINGKHSDNHYLTSAAITKLKVLATIYTVTYSATDASGNKATASATVTVPHDQGKTP